MLADLKMEAISFLKMITIYETTPVHNPEDP
jgi:hypothetical protein